MSGGNVPKQITGMRDIGYQGLCSVLDRAQQLKTCSRPRPCLAGRTLAPIFEIPDMATRISFETAIRQLGGSVACSSPDESRSGLSEGLQDRPWKLSHDIDGLIVRAAERKTLEEVLAWTSIPVLNAGAPQGDPCRVLADLAVLSGLETDFSRMRVAWLGEGSGAAASWIEAAIYFPFELFMAVPPGREPQRELLMLSLQAGARIFLTHEPEMAVDGADYLCIGDTRGFPEAISLPPHPALLSLAAPGARILEARSGAGSDDMEALRDNRRSLTALQQEMRLHMNMAILEWLFQDRAET